jgi:DNA-directed RNA polymerase specialized sigma24 family protein
VSWDRLIQKVIGPRVPGAELLGLERDELLAIGRLASVRAEESYDPEAGRCLSSWVWLCVYYDVDHAIRDVVRQLRADTEWAAVEDDWCETDETAAISAEYLNGNLSSEEWSVLWLRAVDGWTICELGEMFRVGEMAMYQRFSRARKKAVKLLLSAGQ